MNDETESWPGVSILPYKGIWPTLAAGCYLAPGCRIVGDVVLGEQASIWFNSVLRGDVFHIRVGARSNIQDGSVLHVTTDTNATIVGDDVTVGHGVILHGCRVEDGALIGMGAIVMDRAIVREGAMVAAGALVPPGLEVPAGMLAVGSPARVKRALDESERAHLVHSASHYVDIARAYLELAEEARSR